MVTTRFQHLLWLQLRCLILENYFIIGPFNLYVNDISSVSSLVIVIKLKAKENFCHGGHVVLCFTNTLSERKLNRFLYVIWGSKSDYHESCPHLTVACVLHVITDCMELTSATLGCVWVALFLYQAFWSCLVHRHYDSIFTFVKQFMDCCT